MVALLLFVLLLPLPAAAVSLTPTAGFFEMFSIQSTPSNLANGLATFQLTGNNFATSAPSIAATLNLFEGPLTPSAIPGNTAFFFEVAFSGQAGNLQLGDTVLTRMTIDGTLRGLATNPLAGTGDSFTPLLDMSLCFDSGCHQVSGRGLGTVAYADNGNNTFRVTSLGVTYGPLSTVPEPSSWLLFGGGLAGLWAWRWRRCRNTDYAGAVKA